MGGKAAELVKYKPTMDDEFDHELFQRIKFLAMELRTHNPFFGVLATELWIAGPSKSVPTIGVSEKGVIVYNDAFMRSLEPGEIIAVLVHEALHIGLDYWSRFKGLNMKVANWAHDFVINDIIVKSLSEISFTKSTGKVVKLNIKLPPKVLHDLKYRDKSGEEVYLTLIKGIQVKADAAKAAFKEKMTDPVQKAEWNRQEAINKALRESLQKGFQRLGETQSAANAKTRIANPELEKRIGELDDVLSDLKSISWRDTGVEADQATHNPYEKADEPEQPPEHSAEPSNEQEPSQPSDQPSQEPDAHDQDKSQVPNDEKEPEGSNSAKNPIQEAKDKLKDDLNESIRDYAEKEEQRISDEYDEVTPKTSQEENLDDLQNDLDKVADEYVDKVTKARDENALDENDTPESSEPQGNDKKEDSADNGQEAGDKAPSEQDGEPGLDGDEPGNEPGNEQGSEPGNEAGSEQSGSNGQPKPGGQDGEPSNEMGDGDGQGTPGGSPGGSPSQKSQGSQGQPGSSAPDGSDDGYSGEQKSEANARKDVEDALSDIKKELANSLSGQKGGTPGLDQQMASGDDMMENGAFDQAMKDMADELGANELDNDIGMDCDDIPGNPFKGEKPEETDSRKRQMFNRAIQEDMLAGKKMMGTLPEWLQKDIAGILYPPLPFTRKMKKFFGNYGRETKKTFAKANRRNTFFESHMIRKGVIKNESKMYVIQDTSGSMMNGKDLDNLKKSMGLIERLANNQGMEIVVIQCDVGVTARMNTREAMEMINKKQFKLNGLGGSDFTPAFEMAWDEMSKEGNAKGHMICVFTDGAINVPEKPPRNLRQKVLWITNPGQSAPANGRDWGEHVIMDDLNR